MSTLLPRSAQRRTLFLSGLAHALHDGYTDMTYVLLPVWQAEFGLGYGALALLRGLYAGAMAALQLPSGGLSRRFGAPLVLALGTALAAVGIGVAGLSGGIIGLSAALAIAGAGSAVQHPIASAAVVRAFGAAARGPLGIYNFAGDLGKAALPAVLSLAVAMMAWRDALWLFAGVGFAAALAIGWRLPRVEAPPPEHPAAAAPGAWRRTNGRGFAVLLAIGVIDTGVRMSFMTFLPFLLKDKGASLPTVGIGLSLVFIGGAAGKFAFGWIGARFGVLRAVLASETATAAAILGLLALPLDPALVLLPLIGVTLNGTSSVLYGTVPELTPPDATERAFAMFYTGTIGAGAAAPVLFGLLGDAVGPGWATAATAGTALITLPLAIALARRLAVAPE